MFKLYFKTLFSPFKNTKLVWYFGEIKMGTPYFLPRKWVKSEKPGYTKPVPIKYFGFNSNELGWKTKWDEIRFEFSPCISLVLFGKQLWISLIPNIEKGIAIDSYWEAWLYYDKRTNKNLPIEERLKQVFEQYSCTWISWNKESHKEISIDYYFDILDNRYIALYENFLKNK